MSTKFLEIETKYKADDIKVKDFVAFAKSLAPTSILESGSYDHYYVKDENTFIRYREGNRPELTMKQKSKDTNNWVRIELNLPLDKDTPPQRMREVVDEFCGMLGFKHNFTIYKTYLVYFWANHNVVYYVVYDDELKEVNRFIEIEMSEDVQWATQEEAWAALGEVEKVFSAIGISAQRRTRKSLFEMFRKNTDGKAE